MLHASISQEGCSGGADKFGNTSNSDVNQGHMCCQRCFVLQVEQCYGAFANNQGDQCQITGVELPGPESAKLQECVRIRSLCCLSQRDLCRSCFRWKDAQRYVSGGPTNHRVSLMHKITYGSEASVVMFGDQQASLVLSVSILTRKAIQAVVQVEVVFWRSTRQRLKQPAICVHARDVSVRQH